MQQMHPTSNLPTFLHCAMLGKMVTTNSENDNSAIECDPNAEASVTAPPPQTVET